MPKNGQGDFVASRVDFMETWNAMEESVIEGKVKMIGVANFNHKQLERLIEQAKTKPVVNMVIIISMYELWFLSNFVDFPDRKPSEVDSKAINRFL